MSADVLSIFVPLLPWAYGVCTGGGSPVFGSKRRGKVLPTNAESPPTRATSACCGWRCCRRNRWTLSSTMILLRNIVRRIGCPLRMHRPPDSLCKVFYRTEREILLHAVIKPQNVCMCMQQDWAVERTYERLFPSSIIKIFVAMLLMDLAIDSGSSHGSYVSHLMARLAPQRESKFLRYRHSKPYRGFTPINASGSKPVSLSSLLFAAVAAAVAAAAAAAGMRVDCIDILSALMQHCPEKLSFEAMEALQHVVMYELLDLTNVQYFKRTLGLRFRVGCFAGEPVRVMAVATSRSFYIVERPAGLRDPLHPEVEYIFRRGKGIQIFEIRNYRRLTRIVKGFPADNWLAAGWIHKTPQDSAPIDRLGLYVFTSMCKSRV
uniref:Uncharacterized protein n=1 Tax=Eimeria maxima TaxID=5804 RepID=U5U023_EIMMA|nr:hypothetical protein [Eimeria maxima]